MNEEEKEAIKYFYNLRATIDESNMLFDEDINVKCGKETIKKITTILNLIEKQQAEIKKKDNMYTKEYNEHIEKKRQNGVLINNELILKRELEKKDKIINEMAEEISKSIVNTCPLADYNVDLDCENKCKDDYKACWKKYFEYKVEEDK